MNNTIQSLPERLYSVRCSLACAVSALARTAAADTDEDVANVWGLLETILGSLEELENGVDAFSANHL